MASKGTVVLFLLAYFCVILGSYLLLDRYLVDRNAREQMRTAINKGAWKTISKTNDIYVYSAFYDISEPNKVRVIGILPRNSNFNLWCRLQRGPVVYRVKASIQFHPETHGKRLTATFIFCHLREVKAPDTVLIYETKEDKMNLLKVNRISNKIYTHNFSLCLSPFHSFYNNTTQLVHWFEMNILLGVSFFTCYHHNASESVLRIMKYYESLGKAQLLPWTTRKHSNDILQNTSDLHYHGQVAAINDCLYRNKAFSKYVAVYDLDEIITPRHIKDNNWYDMLKRLPDASAYLFRHTMFHQAHVGRVKPHYDDYFIRKNRSIVIYPPYNRSKVIVKTEDVVGLKVHNVWHMKSQRNDHVVVTPEVGLLHHYRLIVYKSMVNGRQEDDSIMKFKHNLTDRVTRTIRRLTGIAFQ